MKNNNPRVIILLDLDCFYAQCEIVRLGVDRTTPVALLQWNSALAVSYPARALGIKRGDSFEKIQKKSNGKCIAFHLPVIPLNSSSGSSPKSEDNSGMTDITSNGIEKNDDADNVKECYERTYKLLPSEQSKLFQEEKNKMRNASEGKASLERYRLASARIFEVILQFLLDNLGEKNFVLERASIDELFLDVTKICTNGNIPTLFEQFMNPTSDNSNAKGTTSQKSSTIEKDTQILDWRERTKFLGSPSFPFFCSGHESIESNDDTSSTLKSKNNSPHPLEIGCMLSFLIRKFLQQSLGFTMSAGISTNKLLAKLAAAHGKPDGMAILYPNNVDSLMDNTNIRKVRNLGGKIGKQVISLLPAHNPPTMGSIRRLLSLRDLTECISCPKIARAVFDACRGEDFEPVRETKLKECCLTKSITAFKSFRPIYNLKALDKWLQLLASDIISRVEIDTKRNKRKPKNCNIQYTFSTQGDLSKRTTRSIRILYPVQKNLASNEHNCNISNNTTTSYFADKVKNALASKNQFPIHRLGLSATDFIGIGLNGSTIDSFFIQRTQHSKSPSILTTEENINNDCATSTTNNKKKIPCHVMNGDDFCEKDGINSNEKSSKYIYTGKNIITKNNYSEHDKIPKNKSEAQAPATQYSLSHKKDSVKKFHQQSRELNNTDTDLIYAQKLQLLYDKSSSMAVGGDNADLGLQNLAKVNPTLHDFLQTKSVSSPKTSESNTRDFIMAKKLQASFDRENTIICSYEKKGSGARKRKIESFFIKKI